MVTNQDVAEKLREIYTLMQLAGMNRFRAIAFDRAARTIEALPEPVSDYIEERSLTDLKGIGKSIAEDIYHYAESGHIPVLNELRETVPEGLIEWLDISGLGPKNIVKIHKELGIETMAELKEACEDGRVASLQGLGEKSAEKILRSISWLEQFGQRILLSEAMRISAPFRAVLSKLDGVQRIDVAGSLRRKRETIGDIDLLVAAEKEFTEEIFDHFVNQEQVTEVLGRGETKSSVRTGGGRQVDLRIVSPEEYPAALLYFTGSKEHNVALRQRARSRSLTLNEYGLFPVKDDGEPDRTRPVVVKGEEEIYQKLGMNPVPPELREGYGEVEEFEEGKGPALVTEDQIRGVIHAHSVWSDGKLTIEEMARACMERGYHYLGISDHSKSAAYAGGLSEDEVKKQWDEIDALNEKLKGEGTEFIIFKGIESDILSDGSLDYADALLEGFDFVIASVHSGLEMSRDRMTHRFRNAIEHPAVRIVGHPTGRLLLRREESDLEMDELIELAAEHNTAIEINANPWRLDLDWRHGVKARETGLLTSINPDAHTIDGIDDIRFGVAIARKGRFEAERVVNTRSAGEFASWISGTSG